jgi:hypothetical protein
MNSSINYFSIEKQFWIRITEHLVNFGYNYLPEDVHFTISFDSRSDKINFHLTRNVSDSKNKPKITIASIEKELFNKLLEPYANALLSKIYIPLDLRFWRGKYGKGLYFCSFADLEKDKNRTNIEEFILRNFKEVSETTKSKLKIKSSFEEKFTTPVNIGKFRNIIINNLKRFPRKFVTDTEVGILFTKKLSFLIVRFNETWYKFNDQLNPMELLKIVVNDETVAELIKKSQESFAIIKTAETYQDTEPYNSPIHLVEF